MVAFVLFSWMLLLGCDKGEKSGPEGSAQSYEFEAGASSKLSLKGATELVGGQLNLSGGPTLCSSVICATATSLEGAYYGVGFLIQSMGNGMVAYFGRSTWSDITKTSSVYAFNSNSPSTHSGDLFCCNGEGDLSNGNSYIESVIYLFAYLDATFTLSGITGNTAMNREFTVRFVLADDGVEGAKRGDLLIKDEGIFKWMDTSLSSGGNVGNGTLVTTRPASPAVMNSSVTNWKNPFEGKGNSQIPVIYVPVIGKKADEKIVVSESMLKRNRKPTTFPLMQLTLCYFLNFLRQT